MTFKELSAPSYDRVQNQTMLYTAKAPTRPYSQGCRIPSQPRVKTAIELNQKPGIGGQRGPLALKRRWPHFRKVGSPNTFNSTMNPEPAARERWDLGWSACDRNVILEVCLL